MNILILSSDRREPEAANERVHDPSGHSLVVTGYLIAWSSGFASVRSTGSGSTRRSSSIRSPTSKRTTTRRRRGCTSPRWSVRTSSTSAISTRGRVVRRQSRHNRPASRRGVQTASVDFGSRPLVVPFEVPRLAARRFRRLTSRHTASRSRRSSKVSPALLSSPTPSTARFPSLPAVSGSRPLCRIRWAGCPDPVVIRREGRAERELPPGL